MFCNAVVLRGNKITENYRNIEFLDFLKTSEKAISINIASNDKLIQDSDLGSLF